MENCVHLPLGARLEKDGLSYRGELLGAAWSLQRCKRSIVFSLVFIDFPMNFSRFHRFSPFFHPCSSISISFPGFPIAPGKALDTIILATGYTYRFPFLDESLLDFGPLRRYVAPLYQHAAKLTAAVLPGFQQQIGGERWFFVGFLMGNIAII